MILHRGLRRRPPRVVSLSARPLSQQAPPPLNQVRVPLIAPALKAQLFPASASPFAPAPASRQAVDISRSHLTSHSLLPSADSPAPVLPPATNFTLPPLLGPTISHHFHHLGNHSSTQYKDLVESYLVEPAPIKPSEPTWSFTPGWTAYTADGAFEPIAYPPEDESVLVFDVETLPHVGGDFAIMAVAVGKRGWYSWVSPWLAGQSDSPNHLIPMGPERESAESGLREPGEEQKRIVVGHNVLFDRARVHGEYSLKRPGTRWLDTMSMHVAVSGLTSPQRPSWMTYRKERDRKEAEEKEAEASPPSRTASSRKKTPAVPAPHPDTAPKTWQHVSSLNSLYEVARLHCSIVHDKSQRDILIDPATTLEDIQSQFHLLMSYCARDVSVTRSVLLALFPKFVATCPHPASFAGVLLMSQPILPVDSKWPQYLERADAAYEERLQGVKKNLTILAEEARKLMGKRNDDGSWAWESDVQLRQLDWSPKRARRLPKTSTGKRSRTAPLVVTSTNAQEETAPLSAEPTAQTIDVSGDPRWLDELKRKDWSLDQSAALLLLEPTYRGFPVLPPRMTREGWTFAVPTNQRPKFGSGEDAVPDEAVSNPGLWTNHQFRRVPSNGGGWAKKLFGRAALKRLEEGVLACGLGHGEMIQHLKRGEDGIEALLKARAEAVLKLDLKDRQASPWLKQLDWTIANRSGIDGRRTSDHNTVGEALSTSPLAIDSPEVDKHDLVWPKWYHDLDQSDGSGLDLTTRKRCTPLLLKLLWKGHPVVHSTEHGWVYRVPADILEQTLREDLSLTPLSFSTVADSTLADDASQAAYFRLPHPDGDEHNVGSPLSRAFLAAATEGVLSSPYPVAKAALELNAECAYWAAARERIVSQFVVWNGTAATAPPPPEDDQTQGLILPQVTPMGTVTRRAVERTWLTASNAKKNRVGSELKSMVRAPPGYAIVGADVDSEELWICSVMGDAQFGIHGATAVGWMTLEGTKNAGTDLHSKTASILGISRDNAKVFNYSRIYGAGVKHAVQLLLKANPALTKEAAKELAVNLYASTKGLTYRGPAFRGKTFWHGGTESFVFNKLEEIAKSPTPKTPAFGCGLTSALRSKYLPAEGRSKAGEGFMPSRINWVVQSSGVDYLHALLVAMEYLTDRFSIDARYMISVHDEIRYLVKEEDKYRAAMALQIANLWTRSLFCYRLQMDDLPQSCAFFSAVDVDHCFRKEVNMACLTPSNPDAIPFGQSLDIDACLAATSNGSLFADGRPMSSLEADTVPSLQLSSTEIRGEQHRVEETSFLAAQTLSDASEINRLYRESRPSSQGRFPGRTLRVYDKSHADRPSSEELAALLRSSASNSPTTLIRRRETPSKLLRQSPLYDHLPRPAAPSLGPAAQALLDEDSFDPDIPDEIEEERYDSTRAATMRATA